MLRFSEPEDISEEQGSARPRSGKASRPLSGKDLREVAQKLKAIRGLGSEGLKAGFADHVEEVSVEQISNPSSAGSRDSSGRDTRNSLSGKKSSVIRKQSSFNSNRRRSSSRKSRASSVFWREEGLKRRSVWALKRQSFLQGNRKSSWLRASTFRRTTGRHNSSIGGSISRMTGLKFGKSFSEPSKLVFGRVSMVGDSDEDSDLDSDEEVELDDQEDDNHPYGVFLDFLCRHSIIAPPTYFYTGINVVVESLLNPLIDGKTVKLLKVDYPACHEIIDSILEERLVYFMAEDICYFWRRKNHPEWPEQDASVVVKHGRDIIKQRRLAECIRAEVERQMAEKETKRAKEVSAKVRLEHMDNRHARLQCFWGQLHKTSQQEQMLETPPPSPWSNTRRGALQDIELTQDLNRPSSSPEVRGSIPQRHAALLAARPASSQEMRRPGFHKAQVRNSSASQLLATQLSPARPASSQALRRPAQHSASSQISATQSSPARPSSSQALRRPAARPPTASRVSASQQSSTRASEQFLGNPALDASLNSRSIASAQERSRSRATAGGVMEQQLAELRRPSSATKGPQKKKHSAVQRERVEEQSKSVNEKLWPGKPYAGVKERDFRKLGKVPRQLSCPIGKQGVPDRREAVVSDLCSEISGYFTPKHFKRKQKTAAASLPNLLSSDGSRPSSVSSRRVQAFIHEEWTPSPSTAPDELLPASGTFSLPWDKNEAREEKVLAGEKYLKACSKQRAVPMALPFVTGHSSKLLGAAHAMSDADVQAVTEMLHSGVKEIEEVDLSENTLLTDKSLVPFFSTLLEDPEMQYPFQRLSLSNCHSAGIGTFEVLIHLLGVPPANLQHVDFNGVAIAQRLHAPLCNAFRDLPELRTLHVANVGFQSSCICELVLSKSLQELDLSWNCFDALVFEQFGTNLVETGKLQRLALCNSASAKQMTKPSPILTFIECLGLDRTLNELDLSTNRMDFRGALVIEDALERHHKLERLNISHNPFGVMGMRSLFRLLAHDSSGLIDFNCENCGMGENGEANTLEVDSEQIFCLINPGGRYLLDLSTPYHRAILRMLCKSCDRFKLLPDAAFTQTNYTSAPARRGAEKGQTGGPLWTKDERGLWRVPTSGRLRVTFSLDQAMGSAMKEMGESDLRVVLQKYFDRTLMKWSFRKMIPLCALWKTLEESLTERDMFLNALSQDFQFSLPMITQLCSGKKGTVAKEVLSALLPWLMGEPNIQFLAKMLSGSVTEYIVVMKNVKAFSGFNPNSPTGHYTLHMANMCDRCVAQRLILLDCWETGLAKNLGHRDTSSRGNMSQIRNEKCNGVPIMLPSMEHWSIPSQGKLDLDYVSVLRPPGNSPALEEITFENILLVVNQSECTADRLLSAIRSQAHTFFLDARQFRMMLGGVALPQIRVELFVTLYFRVVDIHNEKVFRVRFSSEELLRVQRRLGFATFFPFVQPEHMSFALDLQYFDQRLATTIYVALSAAERRDNLKEITYIHQDGTIDPLPMGVPRSWENLAQLPRQGVFKGLYTCAPEERNFKTRIQLLQKFGKWMHEVDEKEVQWWAGLGEAPEDVRIYLDFLVPRFPNVYDAYRLITRGNMISLREFEESMQKIKCDKFKGPDELNRIRQIFRYLDPSGEGQVSEREWGILDLLWREIRLCIEEFDQFLSRTFENDLEFAWDFFDEDKDDCISSKEFLKALETVGYFGPGLPIFKFIDKDDGGSISWDEFKNFKQQLKGFDSRESRY